MREREIKMFDDDIGEVKKEVVVEEKYCYEEERELTVHKTSMFNQGDGFIVYDSTGVILFRVDSYGPVKNHIILMDNLGKPLLTLLHKRPTLHHRWEGFLGENSDDQQQLPTFCIWKSTMIGRSNMIVEVNSGSQSHTGYQIEGSFGERSCTIFRVPSESDHETSKISVAQIKRKVEPTRKMVLGRDVFSLFLKAGFDAAFAMGLVLALDRIDGDDAIIATPSKCHKEFGT